MNRLPNARPGSGSTLRGDHDQAAYAFFTKFGPGTNHVIHTHTNDVRPVVLKGACIYQSEECEEIRVTPGQYLFMPGGYRHASGGDVELGALLYKEADGKFDLNFVR